MRRDPKKSLIFVARLLLIAAGVGYILWTVRWNDYLAVPPGATDAVMHQGLRSLLAEARWGWLAAGMALTAPIVPIQALRWWRLMRCRSLPVSYIASLRLTLVGLFFNFCVPLGSNGGDVVKAYGAARAVRGTGGTGGTEGADHGEGSPAGARSTAVISVVLDRIAGLLGLLILAAVAGPLAGGGAVGRRVTLTAWVILGTVAVGAFVYLNPWTRRALGINLLTNRVDAIQSLDRAVVGYRHHRGTLLAAVALSLPVHVCLAAATALAGYAIGVPTGFFTLVAVLPIVFLVGALPITVLGLGVMEPAAAALLEGSGTTFNQIVAMLMAYRAFLLVYGLLGGLAVLSGGGGGGERPRPEPNTGTDDPDKTSGPDTPRLPPR